MAKNAQFDQWQREHADAQKAFAVKGWHEVRGWFDATVFARDDVQIFLASQNEKNYYIHAQRGNAPRTTFQMDANGKMTDEKIITDPKYQPLIAETPFTGTYRDAIKHGLCLADQLTVDVTKTNIYTECAKKMGLTPLKFHNV